MNVETDFQGMLPFLLHNWAPAPMDISVPWGPSVPVGQLITPSYDHDFLRPFFSQLVTSGSLSYSALLLCLWPQYQGQGWQMPDLHLPTVHPVMSPSWLWVVPSRPFVPHPLCAPQLFLT